MSLRPHRPVIAGATLVAAIGLCACTVPFGNAAPDHAVSRTIFADEFDGAAGSVGGRWQAETGGGGWGNNEAQVYTADRSNVRIDGSGHLAISARYDGTTITSARLTTRGRASVTYGRVEARIALPAGRGLHPAFWLLGDNLQRVGWPRAGEIDVIETVNDASEYHSSIHAPQRSSARGQTVSAGGPAPFRLADTFHTYWMNKTPGRIETGIDGRSLFVVTPRDLASDAQWVFDAPFHLLLTLAVGGDWPGAPDDSTPNPATMLVDWIRVTGL
ncbi:glycoside hydrolase family 16 protein [Gordonia sp. NPDC003424]